MDTKRLDLEQKLMSERYPAFKFRRWSRGKLRFFAWHGDVKVNNINYQIGIMLSSTYPNTRPYIFFMDEKFENLKTSHQDQNKNLCLYTSDGTENAWHRSYSVADVVDRFKKFMDLYQKGKHKNVHKTIVNPLTDLTDEKKYVMDFDFFPHTHGERGFVEFEKSSKNQNFYYAVKIKDLMHEQIELKENKYFGDPIGEVKSETIKWIYLKSESVESILQLKRIGDFKKLILRKKNGEDFFDESLTKCIVFTGRDRSVILATMNDRLSFSNVISIDKSRFFARNKGLVDIETLASKTVAIFGLGSLGSKIAELLTRSGVGKFILCDYDQFTPENLSRHTLTVEDLFKNKSEAIKERIKKINPWAEVTSVATSQNILYYDELYGGLISILGESDYIISATGNEEAEYNINYILHELSKQKVIPAMFAAVLGNGFGGRFHKVQASITPCYQCIKLQQEKDPHKYKLYTEKTFSETNEHKYGIYSEAGIPGLDVDINFIASLATKMALENLLEKKNPIFKFNSYIWGNQLGWVFDEPFQLKEIRFSKISNCPICGGKK